MLLPATLVFAYNEALILTAADAAGDDDVAHAYQAAVASMQTDLTRNREVISRLAMWFYLSVGALVVEVLLWTVSIARYLQTMADYSKPPAPVTPPPGWPKTAPPGFALPEKRDDSKK